MATGKAVIFYAETEETEEADLKELIGDGQIAFSECRGGPAGASDVAGASNATGGAPPPATCRAAAGCRALHTPCLRPSRCSPDGRLPAQCLPLCHAPPCSHLLRLVHSAGVPLCLPCVCSPGGSAGMCAPACLSSAASPRLLCPAQRSRARPRTCASLGRWSRMRGTAGASLATRNWRTAAAARGRRCPMRGPWRTAATRVGGWTNGGVLGTVLGTGTGVSGLVQGMAMRR